MDEVSSLPEVVCAWLKYRKLYALELCASALLCQHLKIIVVGVTKIERVFSRSLTSPAVASADVTDAAAMFHYRQIVFIGSRFGVFTATRTLTAALVNRICTRISR